jgi:hypothetical protein
VPTEALRIARLTSGAGTGKRPPPPGDWSGFVRTMPSGAPLTGAPGTAEPERAVRWLDRDGFAVLPRDSAGRVLIPRLSGYRRWAEASGGTIGFTPIADGALQGRGSRSIPRAAARIPPASASRERAPRT